MFCGLKVLRMRDLFYSENIIDPRGGWMIIRSKLSDEELLESIYRAASEYSNLIGKSYLVVGKNKKSEYFWFQCQFDKKNFMHLLGIESKKYNATEFYDKCYAYSHGKGVGITVADCMSSRNHSRTTINEKSSCCADMLRIQEAKYMKVGLKEKISQYVDFTYGYGSEATLGFKAIGATAIPITMIPKSIDEFVNMKYKIIFVLYKKIGEEKYHCVLSEVKKGLYMQLKSEFPEGLKSMIE